MALKPSREAGWSIISWGSVCSLGSVFSAFSALSVLSLLVQPAQLLIDRMLAIRREIDLASPDLAGDSSLMLAADLTALDLVRCDANGNYLSAADGMAVMLQRMHTLNLATMVQVSQVELDLGAGVGMSPPLAWPYL